jgi:YidC/Oxa1 family membrane protein insertase
MDKRLFLALVLSFVILFGWSAMLSKFYPPEKSTVTNQTASSTLTGQALPADAGTSRAAVPEMAVPEAKTQTEQLWSFEQENFEIVFNENSAAIKEVFFKNYQSYKFSLGSGLLLKNFSFKKEYSGPKKVVFVFQDQEKSIKKQYNFYNSNYDIGLDIEVENLASGPLKMSLPLLMGTTNSKDKTNLDARGNQAPLEVVASTKEKNLYFNTGKPRDFTDLKFAALKERYFCLIVEPDEDGYSGYVHKLNGKEAEVGIVSPEFVLMPGETLRQQFHIYLGPQDLSIIKSIKPEWAGIMHYGMFDLIAQMLLQVLNAVHGVTHNWGWSIILLSLLIYFVLFPLTLKQMRSMKAMQALQPHMEELRKKHKDSPQKLNKELMSLYKEHKVNPLGGCLPFILQIPIFFALYRVLINSVALKGAQFLWITDLSAPDGLVLFGKAINILPLVMAGLMFFQQKMTVTGAGQKAAEQQRMMTFIFPVFFAFIFYSMPAGLVLYWLVNSLMMFLNQVFIQRRK